MKSTNKDKAEKVVNRIIDLIKTGEPLPWVKPWGIGGNFVEIIDGIKTVTITPHAWNRDGKPYRGINNYLPEGEYITFKRCKDEGGKVKKGAKGFPVVYWNFVKKTETDPETGEQTEKVVPFLREWTVFNVKDCEGIEQLHKPEPKTYTYPITHREFVEEEDGDEPMDDTAEQVIADYVSRAGNGFHINRDKTSNKAFYSPSADYVTVPKRSQFTQMGEYYSTLFHELGHSTGHYTRLNRFTGAGANAMFGSEAYSREELVAEMSSATILNLLGLETANTFRNSTAYIKDWSEAISNDPMMYVTACTRASKAVDMILGVSEDDEAEEE